MRRTLWGSVALLSLLAVGNTSAASITEPLQGIPTQADLVIKVTQPRLLVESLRTIPAVEKAQTLAALQPLLDSTSYRRFQQLVAYYERDLGMPWPDLLDALAGHGLALGGKYGDEQPFLLVACGKNAEVMANFQKLATRVLEEEMSRNSDKPTTATRAPFAGTEIISFGNDIHFALLDNAWFVSNQTEAIKRGIACLRDGDKSMNDRPNVKAAFDLLPKSSLAWGWFDLVGPKATEQGKALFASPRNDVIQTLLFGGWLDAAGRSEYVTASLSRGERSLELSIRLPAGRDGMQKEIAAFTATEPGSLPLLEPPGVLFSHTFCWDLGVFYDERKALMPGKVAADFEKGVKDGSRFVPGNADIAKLLRMFGRHHRFVAANQGLLPYKTEPQQRLPAFAFVTAFRDPEFPARVEPLIRFGAFTAATQIDFKIMEENYKGIKIIGWRFVDGGKFPADIDPQLTRFNFMPAFATCKDQFIVASSIDFCKVLIDTIDKQGNQPAQPQTMQMRFYGEGSGAFLNVIPDQLKTQLVLAQAIPAAEAQKQVDEILDLLKKMGAVDFAATFEQKSFRLDLKWQWQ